MANDAYIDEESNEQEMMEMYEEYSYLKSQQGFSDWIYQHESIGNGHQLVNALENTELQEQYLQSVGLPPDTEIE
jgi:hypothetical protein